MKFLIWDERFVLGILAMDEQHLQLAELINEVNDLMIREGTRREAQELMGRIRDTAKAHFQAEEALMVQFGYSGYGGHRGIHQELVKQMELLEQRFGYGGFTFSMEFIHFVRDWLTDHIQGEDKALANFLKRNMPKE